MSAATIVETAALDGIELRLEDGELKVHGSKATVERWLPTLRANKATLVAQLSGASNDAVADLPERKEEGPHERSANETSNLRTDRTDQSAFVGLVGSGLGEPEISQGAIGSSGGAPVGDPQKRETAVPLPATEERLLRAWLASIGETDEKIIAHFMEQCRVDAEARVYYLGGAQLSPLPDFFGDGQVSEDDRRHCHQCANLTAQRYCLAAKRSEIVASRNYQPMDDFPRRCKAYAPGPDDTDRRPGSERWPWLHE